LICSGTNVPEPNSGQPGDDSEPKEIVARLIEEIGFAAVDTGFLHEGGRSQQPDTAVYNKDVTAKEAAKLVSID
jgi:8-hydroxy-5-deazaflavin:NADPH oxidoreductase